MNFTFLVSSDDFHIFLLRAEVAPLCWIRKLLSIIVLVPSWLNPFSLALKVISCLFLMADLDFRILLSINMDDHMVEDPLTDDSKL